MSFQHNTTGVLTGLARDDEVSSIYTLMPLLAPLSHALNVSLEQLCCLSILPVLTHANEICHLASAQNYILEPIVGKRI